MNAKNLAKVSAAVAGMAKAAEAASNVHNSWQGREGGKRQGSIWRDSRVKTVEKTFVDADNATDPGLADKFKGWEMKQVVKKV